ncbi:MAG: RHS repeat-associated core domain-containing protein [Deltaproteobacteria bacterium]|nr:RHS repeat-associated core domain-containing protein [Deltaproteobacteria bacterium]
MKTSLPYFSGFDTPKYAIYAYDPVGRPIEITNPDNTKVKSCYDDWVTVTIDASSHKKRMTKDAYGRLIKVEEYTGTYSTCDTGAGVPYAATTYAYDVLGNLLSVTDARSNQTTMTYDTLGRKTYMHDPDMGNWNYYYDANGNLTSQVDYMGQWIYFQYDALNRLRQKDYSTQKTLGSGDVVYNYDETHTSYGKGRLTSMRDQSGYGSYAYNSRYFYDSLGQGTQVDKVINGVQYTTESTYDGIGRLSGIKYPNLSYSYYTYNGPFVNSVHDGVTTYASYSGYNALGQPGTVTYGNGVATAYTYVSSNYRLNTINTLKGVTTHQNMTYNYDNVGNVTSIVDTINGNQSYGYDELNRLRDYNGSTYYAYDKIGNMTYNAQVGNYTYPASGSGSIRPHAVTTAGGNSYTYDNNGNMTNWEGRTITYYPENWVKEIVDGTTTTSTYDGNGERVRKTSGSTTTTYIGKLYECTGSTCYKYIFANSQRIARKVVGAPNILYYHPDHLGGSSVITDGIGNKVESITYYPYGATRTDTGGPNVRHKYTGQELDSETGLYFYNARYYDPQLGRFISADSIIPDPGDPQSFNRYSYVRNNPINLIDPTGHSWLSDATGINIKIGSKETTALLYQNFSPTFLYGTYQLTQTEQGRTILGVEAMIAAAAVGYYYAPAATPSYGELAQAGAGSACDAGCVSIPLVFGGSSGSGMAISGPVANLIIAAGGVYIVGNVFGLFDGGNDHGNGGGGGGINSPATVPVYYGPGQIAHTPVSNTFSKEDMMSAAMGMVGPIGMARTGASTLSSMREALKTLSKGEIKQLIKGGVHPHDLKPNSRYDLFKDGKGNILVGPRSGAGPGEPTGFNINDF